jgi:hypothetical protein
MASLLPQEGYIRAWLINDWVLLNRCWYLRISYRRCVPQCRWYVYEYMYVYAYRYMYVYGREYGMCARVQICMFMLYCACMSMCMWHVCLVHGYVCMHFSLCICVRA